MYIHTYICVHIHILHTYIHASALRLTPETSGASGREDGKDGALLARTLVIL